MLKSIIKDVAVDSPGASMTVMCRRGWCSLDIWNGQDT